MSSSRRSHSDYFSGEIQDDEEGMSTSSTETSEDEESDYMDGKNGKPDRTSVMQRKKTSGKVQKPVKKNKKNHNASEKNRREQLALCFQFLKDTIGEPQLTNNVALEKSITLIPELKGKQAALQNEVDRLSQNLRPTSSRQINNARNTG